MAPPPIYEPPSSLSAAFLPTIPGGRLSHHMADGAVEGRYPQLAKQVRMEGADRCGGSWLFTAPLRMTADPVEWQRTCHGGAMEKCGH